MYLYPVLIFGWLRLCRPTLPLYLAVRPQLTEEEKAKLAEEAAKKAQRKHQEGGGLNPLAVLFLLLAIAVGEQVSPAFFVYRTYRSCSWLRMVSLWGSWVIEGYREYFDELEFC